MVTSNWLPRVNIVTPPGSTDTTLPAAGHDLAAVNRASTRSWTSGPRREPMISGCGATSSGAHGRLIDRMLDTSRSRRPASRRRSRRQPAVDPREDQAATRRPTEPRPVHGGAPDEAKIRIAMRWRRTSTTSGRRRRRSSSPSSPAPRQPKPGDEADAGDACDDPERHTPRRHSRGFSLVGGRASAHGITGRVSP